MVFKLIVNFLSLLNYTYIACDPNRKSMQFSFIVSWRLSMWEQHDAVYGFPTLPVKLSRAHIVLGHCWRFLKQHQELLWSHESMTCSAPSGKLDTFVRQCRKHDYLNFDETCYKFCALIFSYLRFFQIYNVVR